MEISLYIGLHAHLNVSDDINILERTILLKLEDKVTFYLNISSTIKKKYQLVSCFQEKIVFMLFIVLFSVVTTFFNFSKSIWNTRTKFHHNCQKNRTKFLVLKSE